MKKNEIQTFKTILENRKKTILGNLQGNFREVEALHNSVPSDSVDFSVIEIGSQIDFAISANLKQELEEIEDSLEKIEDGIYGIYESCDEGITVERFKIKPHVKCCIVCRENLEKRELWELDYFL